MPSIQAKIAYFIAKRIWRKRNLTKENLLSSRKRSKNAGKLFLSPQPVHKSSKVINGITVDIIEPENKSKKIVLYVHGGGFVLGITPFHYGLINRLAADAKVKIFAIHYSLAPENLFPKQITQTKDFYQWLLKQGYKAKEIFFAGDSAGGSISIATAIMLRDEKLPLPAGIISISAPTDATFSYPSFVNNEASDIVLTRQRMRFFLDSYRGKESAKHPLISPIFANLKNLPKMQLFASDNELPFDDIVNFSKKLKKYRVPYELNVGEKLAHAYPLAARFIPEAKKSIKQMARFINET